MTRVSLAGLVVVIDVSVTEYLIVSSSMSQIDFTVETKHIARVEIAYATQEGESCEDMNAIIMRCVK
jgi:hypothetical protein